jgi:hypothetical protein
MQTLEKELLEMSKDWKETAQEMIAKSEGGSRSEMVNRMLYACAEILEHKIKTAKVPTAG